MIRRTSSMVKFTILTEFPVDALERCACGFGTGAMRKTECVMCGTQWKTERVGAGGAASPSNLARHVGRCSAPSPACACNADSSLLRQHSYSYLMHILRTPRFVSLSAGSCGPWPPPAHLFFVSATMRKNGAAQHGPDQSAKKKKEEGGRGEGFSPTPTCRQVLRALREADKKKGEMSKGKRKMTMKNERIGKTEEKR